MASSLYSVTADVAEGNSTFPFQTVLTTDSQNVNIDAGITLATIEVPDEVAFDDDEQDFFQCGKCKEAFTSFAAFVLHKKEHNKETRKQFTEVSHVGQLSDQVTNLVFTDSDIISLGIDESALDMTDGQSMVLDTCAEIALMSRRSSQTCDLPTISSEEVTIATSVTNDDVLEEYTNIGSTDDSIQTCNVPTVTSENATVATPARKSNDLKCIYCVKSFKCNFDLQQHVRSHTGEKPFQCVVCGRAFAQKSAVRKHMSTHKVWPKHLCYATRPSWEAPEDSSGLPNNPEESSCSQASDEDSTSLDRSSTENTNSANGNDELDNEDDEDEMCSYFCQFCPWEFDSHALWKNHIINKHKCEKVYKCIQSNCDAMFKELEEFVEHTNEHETESDSIYNCHVCHKAFTSLDNIGRHQFTHSLPTQAASKLLKCKTCKSKFKNVENLKRHQDTESHKYTCPKCNKEFKTQRYLKAHMQVHSATADYTCPYCLRSFKKKVYLSTHMRTHTDVKRYTCSHCSSSFYRRDLLTRHLLTHENTKKFKCPFKNVHNCDREFNRSDKLKAHILTHCSKEIRKCSKCDKSFLKPSLHKEHQKTCNGGGIKLICPPPKADVEESNQERDEPSTIEIYVLATGKADAKSKAKRKRISK